MWSGSAKLLRLSFALGAFCGKHDSKRLQNEKFSPRCARLFFFIDPAPARGGPSASSENWISPLRHIFFLHTRCPKTAVSKRRNVDFPIGFGRASFSDTASHEPRAWPCRKANLLESRLQRSGSASLPACQPVCLYLLCS